MTGNPLVLLSDALLMPSCSRGFVMLDMWMESDQRGMDQYWCTQLYAH